MSIPSQDSLLLALQKKRQHEGDNSVASLFYKAGLYYFVEGKAKCWWCTEATQTAASEMLFLFTLQETAEIKKYKEALANELLKCTACVAGYHQAKKTLKARYETRYAPENVRNFFSMLELWDAERVEKALARLAGAKSSGAGQIVLYEALYESWLLLSHGRVVAATCTYIRARMQASGVLNMGNVLLPGFITLYFNADKVVRSWALQSIKLATNKQVPLAAEACTPVFFGLLKMLAERLDDRRPLAVSSKHAHEWLSRITYEFSAVDVWHGLRIMLGRLSTKTKEEMVENLDNFSVIVCKSMLDIGGDEFVDALRVFSAIIDAESRDEAWPKITQTLRLTPAGFVDFVMQHAAVRGRFRKTISTLSDLSDAALERHNRYLRPVIEWVTPFFESLVLPQDTPPVVALLNTMLLEIRADPEVPLGNKALSVHMAIAIIKHCFKLPTIEKLGARSRFVLREFLEENLDVIVNIAQNQDPLSQSEILITRAEELIDIMLQGDLGFTYNAFDRVSEVVQSIREDPETLKEADFSDRNIVPTLIQFPKLWVTVLQNPQNVTVFKHAMFAASYMLLFDPLPSDLSEHLPSLWSRAYSRFEDSRKHIATMTRDLMVVLADSLGNLDASTRQEFDNETLVAQLRYLVSPATSIHPVVLRVLQVSTSYSGFEEDYADEGAGSEKQRSIDQLDSTERDMVCYDLFNRHREHFIDCLTSIVNDCNILVYHGRPAHTSSKNVAMLARSLVSVAGGLIDSANSEAMARLFFAFCKLFGLILKASSEQTAQLKGRNIYTATVPGVFKIVYSMLNAVEFSNFVRLAKDSSALNEDEAMDGLSTCVSQMLNYLEDGDKLSMASDIIKTLDLVASGLAATPGTSMIYPVETVQNLINGTTGNLSPKLRVTLRSITSQFVWEARSIAISRSRPVQIIINDVEDVFAGMDDSEINDMLGDAFAEDADANQSAVKLPEHSLSTSSLVLKQQESDTGVLQRTESVPSVDVGHEMASLAIKDKPQSAPPLESTDDVYEVQLTPEDAASTARRKQTSMDRWLGRAGAAGGSTTSSLSSQLALRTAEAKTRSASDSAFAQTKDKKSSASAGGSVLGQLRSSFARERQGTVASRPPQTGTSSLKNTVAAPRSMATVPIDKWAADRFSKSNADVWVPPPMYVRNVSKAAVAAAAATEGEKSARSQETANIDVLSDSSSSSDEDEDDDDSEDADAQRGAGRRGGALAGLIKIMSPVKTPAARTIKMIPLPGMATAGKGNILFTQQARDRAAAERNAKARLLPNINSLYAQLLKWQYEESGDMPPQMQSLNMLSIPDQFQDCDEYARVFEPLLLLECWAQFQRAKEEAASSAVCEAKLESRMSVDAFQEITYMVDLADMGNVKINDVVVFGESLSREKRLGNGIPVFGNLDTAKSSSSTTSVGGSSSGLHFSGRKTFLGMVKSRVYRKEWGEVVVQVSLEGARLAMFMNLLVLHSTWEFVSLFSLTPMQREYAALKSLPHLDPDLVRKILKPREMALGQGLSRVDVQECMATHMLNQPQAEAVMSAIRRDHGFTLIQGPPGTGKTKTILGLTGALLSLAKNKKQTESLNSGFGSGSGSSTAMTTTSAVGGAIADSAANGMSNKLLICAPSNAAVDEIVKRLKCGIRDGQGKTFFPSVVRVGKPDSVSSTVRDTTLEFLLEKALDAFKGKEEGNTIEGNREISDSQSNLLLAISGRSKSDGKTVMDAVNAKDTWRNADEKKKKLGAQISEINTEIRQCTERISVLEMNNPRKLLELQEQLRKAYQKKRQLLTEMKHERERVQEASVLIEATKHKLRLQIMQKTDILCCTLSGSGHEALTSMKCTFDTVIIDEAAQSIELACLIPLKYGCERCILVGDPNQLPPTVMSQAATKHMYNQSMFVRIQKNSPESVSLLSIQYRMHPEISAFPSRLFYDSLLKDGPDMAKKQAAVWHNQSQKRYPPFAFYNFTAGKEERGRSKSVFNMTEVLGAVQLVARLLSDYSYIGWKQRIGVITPYKQQLVKLIDKFKEVFGGSVTDAIEFNTVDGFQGQEKDIIIFSCVRAGESGVGFLSDRRRMNVGLTRARKSLFILGNAELLVSSPLWRDLIDESRKRGLLRDSALPLFNQNTRAGMQFTCLFEEEKVTETTQGDGEGIRSEFIMEDIDDAALAKRNEAIENAGKSLGDEVKLNSSASAMDVDSAGNPEGTVSQAPEKRKHPALQQAQMRAMKERRLAESAKSAASTSVSASGAAFAGAHLSSDPTMVEDGEIAVISESTVSSGSVTRPHPSGTTTHVNPRAAVRPPAANFEAQRALAREKQRKNLFIPTKRGGAAGTAARGPGRIAAGVNSTTAGDARSAGVSTQSTNAPEPTNPTMSADSSATTLRSVDVDHPGQRSQRTPSPRRPSSPRRILPGSDVHRVYRSRDSSRDHSREYSSREYGSRDHSREYSSRDRSRDYGRRDHSRDHGRRDRSRSPASHRDRSLSRGRSRDGNRDRNAHNNGQGTSSDTRLVSERRSDSNASRTPSVSSSKKKKTPKRRGGLFRPGGSDGIPASKPSRSKGTQDDVISGMFERGRRW